MHSFKTWALKKDPFFLFVILLLFEVLCCCLMHLSKLINLSKVRRFNLIIGKIYHRAGHAHPAFPEHALTPSKMFKRIVKCTLPAWFYELL